MMRKFLFPHPKTKLDEKTQRMLVYIPAFSSRVTYGILRKYVKTEKQLDLPESLTEVNTISISEIGSNLCLELIEPDEDDECNINQINPSATLFTKKGMIVTVEDDGPICFEEGNKELKKASSKILEKENTFLRNPLNTIDFKEPIRSPVSRLVTSPDIYVTAKQSIVQGSINRSKSQVDSMGVVDTRILRQTFQHYVPCLYYPFQNSDYYVLYFHSNGEDVTQLRYLVQLLALKLECNVMAMEYPGYSVYNSKKANAPSICQDAESVLRFLMETCRVDASKIMLIGRSIGSGPAVHLSTLHRFAMMILISPFLTVKEIVKDKVGFLSKLVSKHFNNAEKIQLNQSPLLLLHGKNDKLINSRHSEKLYNLAKSKAKLVVFDDMPHNKFNFTECVIEPVLNFMQALKIHQFSDSSESIYLMRDDRETNQDIRRFFKNKII